jgi:hypothetical protein
LECKCGGKLNRIAVDCYACENCGLKQKVAFIHPEIDIKPQDIPVISCSNNINKEIIKSIEDSIYSNFVVSEKLFNSKR